MSCCREARTCSACVQRSAMTAAVDAAGAWAPGGNKPFMASNPPYGAPVTYYLKEKGAAKIEILDTAGRVIRDLGPVPQDAGLNRVTWDLRYQGP